MALEFSTALRNAIGSGYSWNEALSNGELIIYPGSKVADADTAETATELVRFSLTGSTYTAPTQCVALLTIAGTSGTFDELTVGGTAATTGIDLLGAAVTNPGTAAALITLVVAQINAKPNPLGIYAEDGTGDTINLYAPKMVGAAFNTLNLFASATTTTVTVNGGSSSTMGGTGGTAGVAASNGLNFQVASSGALAKETTAWQGDASATGTAGHFRYVAGGHDETTTGVTEICFDGTVATSGGDLNLSSLSITSGATQTINTFTITVPSS